MIGFTKICDNRFHNHEAWKLFQWFCFNFQAWIEFSLLYIQIKVGIEFSINGNWSSALNDPTSDEFKEIATIYEAPFNDSLAEIGNGEVQNFETIDSVTSIVKLSIADSSGWVIIHGRKY